MRLWGSSRLAVMWSYVEVVYGWAVCMHVLGLYCRVQAEVIPQLDLSLELMSSGLEVIGADVTGRGVGAESIRRRVSLKYCRSRRW